MVSFNKNFIISVFESYIVQWILGMEARILINIQWLLFVNTFEKNCLSIYVWFMWLHMCVVGNLMTIVFECITFALWLLGVGCLTIH